MMSNLLIHTSIVVQVQHNFAGKWFSRISVFRWITGNIDLGAGKTRILVFTSSKKLFLAGFFALQRSRISCDLLAAPFLVDK